MTHSELNIHICPLERKVVLITVCFVWVFISYLALKYDQKFLNSHTIYLFRKFNLKFTNCFVGLETKKPLKHKQTAAQNYG